MSSAAFFPQDIIARKRDGYALSREEIEAFVEGVVRGDFLDYQSSALLMAIYLRGMSSRETGWLTDAMMRSGTVLDFSDIAGPKIDKHSTGGVGDKVSLILAPWAAACGLRVPMMSGRGLGHTGGTLDKLEAIPGFRVGLSVPEFRRQLADIGVALIGQTPELVPADRKLYALRDVTATVECIPLICASIMSKKLAEGIDALVLDVKFGRGAFMKSREEAHRLAEAMVGVGREMGKPTRALLTAMDEPLGHAAGNALEVIEAIECLKGRGPADLMAVTEALVAQMLLLGGAVPDESAAGAIMARTLADGSALEKFRACIAAQGGDPGVIDDYARLPGARYRREVSSGRNGYVASVDALAIGRAALILGAGRTSMASGVDPAVGISGLLKCGAAVAAGEGLACLHGNDMEKLARAERLLREAIVIEEEPPPPAALVAEVVD